MHQALDRLSIHMGNEVSSVETCLVGRAALLHALSEQQHSEREERRFI